MIYRKKNISTKIISLLLTFVLVFNSTLPYIVFAQYLDPGDGGGNSDPWDGYDSTSPAGSSDPGYSQDNTPSYGNTPDNPNAFPEDTGSEDATPTPTSPPEYSGDEATSDYNQDYAQIQQQAEEEKAREEARKRQEEQDRFLYTADNPTGQPIIVDPTTQNQAVESYVKEADSFEQYQQQDFANIRADGDEEASRIAQAAATAQALASGGIGALEGIGAQIIGTVERIITPSTDGSERRAAELLAKKADESYQQAEKERVEALQAAVDLSPEQRIAVLNTSLGFPQNTSPDKTLSLFNDVAETLGVRIDIQPDGSYTVYLTQPSPAPALTYTPYVPGLSFASPGISATQTIDPKPFCSYEKDPAEKEKCQKEWNDIADAGALATVAVAAAGTAVVTAPVWLPVAGAGISTAATVINTGSIALYVYPTTAGAILLSKSPAIVQNGIGILAQTSSVVIPAAVWASCQFEGDPVDCVSRNLGMPDLPIVLAGGAKVISGTRAVTKLGGEAEVAAEEAIRLAGGAKNTSIAVREGTEGLAGEALYIPPHNQPRNIVPESITDDMRFNDFDAEGINTGAEALARMYPDTKYQVLSAQGSSAVIFEAVGDPTTVYKVYRNDQDWSYATKEADTIRQLSGKGLAPPLYGYYGEGETSVPVLVMGKVNFSKDGYKQLTAVKMEAEIKRVADGLKDLGMEPGDVEFVVDNTTGHLISVDSGGFYKLNEKGLTHAGETVEAAVRSDIESNFFRTFFIDGFRQNSNPLAVSVETRAELQKLGFSNDIIDKELYKRYHEFIRSHGSKQGRYVNADLLTYPFNQDTPQGHLLHLANDVASGIPESQIQRIANSLSGKFSQDVVDKTIEAGRKAGQVKGVSIASSLTSVNTGISVKGGYDFTKIITADDFEVQEKKRLIKNVLLEKGEIDSKEVITILQTDLLNTQIKRLEDGSYLLKTNRQGVSEGEIEKGKYLINVGVIPGYDIKVASYVDLSMDEKVLGISVKQGSGKVEKVGFVGRKDDIDFSLVKQAYAQGIKDQELSEVKAVLFRDSSGNGIYDEGEEVLPWAGVNILLKKIEVEDSISLIQGWNLITLTALPDKPLTASSLLSEIVLQGGYTTTVSTLSSGAWKSYVKRGDATFSSASEDFAIEPGKAYFIKADKNSIIKMTGQNFAAPVKHSLDAGWNAVGFPDRQKTIQASALLETLSKDGTINADAVAAFESGLWETLVKKDKEDFGENFLIYKNRGYILRVDKDGEVVLK